MHGFSLKKLLPLCLSLVFIILLAMVINLIKNLGYHLVYCPSKSVAPGIYLITPIKEISRFDLVEATPPNKILSFIKDKHWLGEKSTILKYVFAIPGDYLCLRDEQIVINHHKVGHIHKFYAPNKRLPQTKFCGKIPDNQYLLLSTMSERSFDGRYFGPVSRQNILGKAILLIKT
jgi:conjugative transfer signal peptidase TraF